MRESNEVRGKRSHKDTVFRMLFREKRELLSLYNAINGSAYTDPEALEIVTLEKSEAYGADDIQAGSFSICCWKITTFPCKKVNCLVK